MLVDVKTDVETLECRLSLRLFRGSVNSSEEKNSQPHCEAVLTDRKEVQFNSNSNAIDRHNFNIQEVLKTCMYM